MGCGLAGTEARLGSPVAAPGRGATFDDVSIPSHEQPAIPTARPIAAAFLINMLLLTITLTIPSICVRRRGERPPGSVPHT